MKEYFQIELRRFHRDESGQTLAFVALVCAYLFMFIALTINVGEVIGGKVKSQAAADTAALSAAAWQARGLNTIQALNCAIMQVGAINTVAAIVDFFVEFFGVLFSSPPGDLPAAIVAGIQGFATFHALFTGWASMLTTMQTFIAFVWVPAVIFLGNLEEVLGGNVGIGGPIEVGKNNGASDVVAFGGNLGLNLIPGFNSLPSIILNILSGLNNVLPVWPAIQVKQKSASVLEIIPEILEQLLGGIIPQSFWNFFIGSLDKIPGTTFPYMALNWQNSADGPATYPNYQWAGVVVFSPFKNPNAPMYSNAFPKQSYFGSKGYMSIAQARPYVPFAPFDPELDGDNMAAALHLSGIISGPTTSNWNMGWDTKLMPVTVFQQMASVLNQSGIGFFQTIAGILNLDLGNAFQH